MEKCSGEPQPTFPPWSKPFLGIACRGDRTDAVVMDPWSADYRAEMGLALIDGIARDILIALMGGQLTVVFSDSR